MSKVPQFYCIVHITFTLAPILVMQYKWTAYVTLRKVNIREMIDYINFPLYEIRYPIYPRSRVNHIETNNIMKIHVTETKEVKKTYLAFNSKFLIKENTRQLLLLESLLLHLYQYRWHLYSVLSAGYVPLCTCLNYTYPTIS